MQTGQEHKLQLILQLVDIMDNNLVKGISMGSKLSAWWKESKPTIGDIFQWSMKSVFITAMVILLGASALPPLTRNLFGAAFKPVVQEVMQEELLDTKNMLEKLDKRLEYTYNWTINFEVDRINKQYEKIKTNPGDIYSQDILAVIDVWGTLPDNIKSPKLIKKYQVVEEYYFNMEVN